MSDKLTDEDSGTYVSRLVKDVASHSHPGHVHRAGTEFAPIRRIKEGVWLIELRVDPVDSDSWWEQLEAKKSETEVAFVTEPRDH